MKKFRITVLILFAIGIVFMIMGLIVSNSNLKHDARSNTECRTDQRVFDYADKLTGNEEDSMGISMMIQMWSRPLLLR